MGHLRRERIAGASEPGLLGGGEDEDEEEEEDLTVHKSGGGDSAARTCNAVHNARNSPRTSHSAMPGTPPLSSVGRRRCVCPSTSKARKKAVSSGKMHSNT